MLAALVVYLVGLLALAIVAQQRTSSPEDYLVAGRRLGLFFSWGTLVATWFGAGTLLAVSDEVYKRGLAPAALDPLGAGLCLIIAGFWMAKPLRERELLTLSDLFRDRFDTRVERLSALLLAPSYFGWIAAQFVALARVLHRLFALQESVGVALVAIVGTSYTVLGGLWSVTLTDALQLTLIIAGIGTLGNKAYAVHPGFGRISGPIYDGKGLQGAIDTIGLLVVGALGNLPGQDLAQRMLAARNARIAQRASVLAGVTYLGAGAVVVWLAMVARDLLPPEGAGGQAVMVALAEHLLSGPLSVIFILALVSAVLSTIDSAILSPSSVLAQNLIAPLFQVTEPQAVLRLNRLAILGVALVSLVIAYLGESAYTLLEQAYAMPLVTLLVPLAAAIGKRAVAPQQAIWAMAVGLASWGMHLALGWKYLIEPLLGGLPVRIPMALGGTLLSALAFWIARPRATAPLP